MPQAALGSSIAMSTVRRRAASKAAGARTAKGRTLEAELGFRIGRAHRALREAWSEQIADLELTPPQAVMLRAVAEAPGIGLRELGRRTHTDAMNAKRLVDQLERAGLVESVVDPRHRQRRVLRPTGAGARLASEVSRRASAWDRQLSRLVGPGELEALRILLERLEAAAASTSVSGVGPRARTRPETARGELSASGTSAGRAPRAPRRG